MNADEAKTLGTEKRRKSRNVGKLNPSELGQFEDNNPSVSEPPNHQREAYVPVIIDKAAFERTVGRFENYVDEEEEREKRRAEAKRVKLEQQRLKEEEARLQKIRQEEEEELKKYAHYSH